MKTKIFLSGLVLTFLFSCSNNDSRNTKNVTQLLPALTLLNISYGSDSKQVLDLYLPANRSETTTKTIILVHGGGWIEGDKTDMAYLIPFLQQNLPNYAIANINYRLANNQNYAFPMQLNDMKAVLDKLKNDKNNISDNFGYIGTSAGAHLSMLYSYKNNADNNIKMVVSIVGPTNFRDSNYTNNPAWIANYLALTGVNYNINPEYFETISPYYNITVSALSTLLLYGNNDNLIPNSQHIALKSKLDQQGVYNEYKVYDGGHGNWNDTDLLDAAYRIKNFITLKF